MPIPKYVSAEKYSRDSGIGVEEVKKMCRNGELKCHMTEGGYYKIQVDQDSVPIEKYEKLKKENIELKAILKTIYNCTKDIERV